MKGNDGATPGVILHGGNPSPAGIGHYTLLLPTPSDEQAFWDERAIGLGAMEMVSAVVSLAALLFVGLQRRWTIHDGAHPLVTEVIPALQWRP